MDLQKQLSEFKLKLMVGLPFYGDIIWGIPFEENINIPTAGTNGRKIMYNSKYLTGLNEGQRNFIVMHELMHILLNHCERCVGKDTQIWNVAGDIIVNSFLDSYNFSYMMKDAGIPFEIPDDAIVSNVDETETTENLYEKILRENEENEEDDADSSDKYLVKTKEKGKKVRKSKDKIKIKSSYGDWKSEDKWVTDIPDDMLAPSQGAEDDEALSHVHGLIREAFKNNAEKLRGSSGSRMIHKEVYGLVDSKRINWKRLLRNFIDDQECEEASYLTPERKYLHMDLILPGYGSREEVLQEVWAFVDSSGSISKNELEQFLTQLYRLSKEFRCRLNICYWDTEVSSVYLGVASEKDVLNCVPSHAGGTDINCVYKWLRDHHIKPEVMIILTDGQYGELDMDNYIPALRRKTVMILSDEKFRPPEAELIGKITYL